MCGILLHATLNDGCHTFGIVPEPPQSSSSAATGPSTSSLPSWWEPASRSIAARGPDNCSGTISITADITACVSVLGLRGASVKAQPLYSSDRSLVLLWNGEVFDASLSGFDFDAHDGTQLLDHIEAHAGSAGVEAALTHVLGSIEGPYATVLIDITSGRIYFARDPLGRRSLLVSAQAGTISLASVSPSNQFSEVDCGSIWRASLLESNLVALPRPSAHFPGPAELIELSKSMSNAFHAAESVSLFAAVLSESVRQRVQHVRQHGDGTGAQVGILFSGGVDCSTIAILAHKHLPLAQPIDLLNVAFENPRVLKAATTGSSANTELNGTAQSRDPYDVPDRRTSRQSLEELQQAAPERRWRLVEVNVAYEEYVQHRATIEALMSPCTSVMDLSIAAALYFAARARGSSSMSSAKVLLSGLGADELLGGYSRHRQAFQTRGLNGLVQELQMDLDRLPTRNLGRDDRVISSSGKECRYPFLAYNVIHFLAALPVELKMDLTMAPGRGDKRLLRTLAETLGLPHSSALAKRAIQFGARSAKMDQGDGRIKGHELLHSHAATV